MNTDFKAIHEQNFYWLDTSTTLSNRTLGFAPVTACKLAHRTREFFTWLTAQNVTSINRVTSKHVTRFFDYQENRTDGKVNGKLSAAYLNQYFAAIDKLLEFLHQWFDFAHQPMGMDNAPAPQNRCYAIDEEERIRKIEPFTIEEIKTMQAQIENAYPDSDYRQRQARQYQLRLVFALYYACGLRRSEGARLTAKDVDFNRRTLFVRQGKNYKDRIIPLSENVINALQDYIYNFRNLIKCGHDRLFIHHPNRTGDYLLYLQRLCPDDGIQGKRLSFHILRHSIATHLLQNGMDMVREPHQP
jgi:integrase/recombinase XerD